MVGANVLTQRDVQVDRTKTDTIAIASYAFDSHHVSRWIDGARRLRVEGGFWNGRAAATRWSIPYRSLTPRASEVTNLLVSVTASATHVAFAALRLEPQYMMMGEAAGAARGDGRVGFRRRADPRPGRERAALRSRLKHQGAVIDNFLFWDIAAPRSARDIERTFLAA